jgi:hypothetical protein
MACGCFAAEPVTQGDENVLNDVWRNKGVVKMVVRERIAKTYSV